MRDGLCTQISQCWSKVLPRNGRMGWGCSDTEFSSPNPFCETGLFSNLISLLPFFWGCFRTRRAVFYLVGTLLEVLVPGEYTHMPGPPTLHKWVWLWGLHRSLTEGVLSLADHLSPSPNPKVLLVPSTPLLVSLPTKKIAQGLVKSVASMCVLVCWDHYNKKAESLINNKSLLSQFWRLSRSRFLQIWLSGESPFLPPLLIVWKGQGFSLGSLL